MSARAVSAVQRVASPDHTGRSGSARDRATGIGDGHRYWSEPREGAFLDVQGIIGNRAVASLLSGAVMNRRATAGLGAWAHLPGSSEHGFAPVLTANRLLVLQRSAGNSAVQSMAVRHEVLGTQRLAGDTAAQSRLHGAPVVQRQAKSPGATANTARSTVTNPPVSSPLDTLRAGLPLDVQIKIDASSRLDGPEPRVVVMGVYRMLKRMGYVWGLVERIKWVGESNMLVEVTNPQEFKLALEGQGFTASWFPTGGPFTSWKFRWGLRKTIDGVGLHVKCPKYGPVEIRFDLWPPKWWQLLGLWHLIMDNSFRKQTVTSKRLRRALRLEGRL